MEFSAVVMFRVVNSILPPTPSTNYSSKEIWFKELCKAYFKYLLKNIKYLLNSYCFNKHSVLHSILHSAPLTEETLN